MVIDNSIVWLSIFLSLHFPSKFSQPGGSKELWGKIIKMKKKFSENAFVFYRKFYLAARWSLGFWVSEVGCKAKNEMMICRISFFWLVIAVVHDFDLYSMGKTFYALRVLLFASRIKKYKFPSSVQKVTRPSNRFN